MLSLPAERVPCAFEPTKAPKQRHEFTLFTGLPEPESDDGSSRRFPIIARFHRCYVPVRPQARTAEGIRGSMKAHAARQAFDAKGDTVAAVIFVNDVDSGRLARSTRSGALGRRDSVFYAS
jgi:hypothetical protein